MICTRCLRDVVPGSLRTAGCAHCAGEFVHTSGYVHCDGLEPMRCVGWEITAGPVGGGKLPDNAAAPVGGDHFWAPESPLGKACDDLIATTRDLAASVEKIAAIAHSLLAHKHGMAPREPRP